MSIIEAKVEAALVKAVTAAGGICWKWPATARAGVPDRIVVLGGRVAFVELKRPGEKPRPLQLDVHRRLRAAGADVRVIDTVECARDFVRGLV
jgi:hypothetical protein